MDRRAVTSVRERVLDQDALVTAMLDYYRLPADFPPFPEHRMDLSIEHWEGVTSSEREAIARRLAMQLPSGFTFHTIQPCHLRERRNDVALYKKDNATFAFIPAGAVSLGHDVNRPWEPDSDELESWRETAEEYGITGTLPEYVAGVTLPVRRTELSPFLIETTARELGWEVISLDDPEVREILGQYKTQSQVEVCRGNSSIRVRRNPDHSPIAERSLPQTYADLAAQLSATGFRFPTSDEWEYSCGCGTQTLFRWGDHVPCNRYPTDVSPAEAAWGKEWVLSGGKLERPAEGFASDWDYHRCPNAFGLHIASDPYKSELVAEPGVTRGGDGGGSICGGVGFFVGWLTLATAFFEGDCCNYDPITAISPGYTIGRRVLALE